MVCINMYSIQTLESDMRKTGKKVSAVGGGGGTTGGGGSGGGNTAGGTAGHESQRDHYENLIQVNIMIIIIFI
jgi:hypothetical protein